MCRLMRIMMRGSANRSLDEARTKRKNIFYVVPECGPCSSQHSSDSDEYVSAGEVPYDVASIEGTVDGRFSADEGPYNVDVQMEIVPPPTYSYGDDGFQLYGFPHLKLGESIGLVGPKHTAPQWQAIMDHLDVIKDQPGAKEFCTYFPRIKANDLKFVSGEDLIEMQQQKTFQEMVREILTHHIRRNPYKVMEMCHMVGIDDEILTSLPSQLTNTGIQKVKIMATLLREADAYLLDEPSSYLTRKERLGVSHAIVSVIGPNRYVVVADEDVNMVEHISKYIFIGRDPKSNRSCETISLPLTLDGAECPTAYHHFS
ncbi:hypothetical protein Bca52824_064237 [Brassica carinata]|uniref:ABC transporter domain-containing protein n=1 Tax=Brassica carinata TaxID=52824 RepID=A0A8X7QI00_BRACI|nr:hypothetical protein Bca52824_064237 [Brassica carinata]